MLFHLEAGRYRSEQYIFHTKGGKHGEAQNILMLSNKHVFYIKHTNTYALHWFFPVEGSPLHPSQTTHPLISIDK